MVLVEGSTELVLGVGDLAGTEPIGGISASAVPHEGGSRRESAHDPVPGRLGFQTPGFEIPRGSEVHAERTEVTTHYYGEELVKELWWGGIELTRAGLC